MTPLNQIVSIRRRFLRSVNIARDQKRPQGLDGYILTPLILQTLIQLTESLITNTTDRAFTLTGPYGTGKSSFALFLFQLLQNRNGYAWELVRQADHKVANLLWNNIFGHDNSTHGILVIPITSRRASITNLLADAFDELEIPLREQISPQIESLRTCKDSKTSIRLIEKITTLAIQSGYKGLFLIFDELGKVFEEAYFNKKDVDIYLLQDLAEAASRSGNKPLLILGMLHQSFGN